MFLAEEFRGRGEWPEKPKKGPEIPSSKGYPARRDPQAENPQGVLPKQMGSGDLYRYRIKYGR